jgi:hypothetical protein
MAMVWRAVLAAAALVLAGCAESGGLRALGEPAEVCVPADADRLATVSLDRLENVTDHEVTITAVALVDGQDLEVANWYTIPGDGEPPGVLSGYTPPPTPYTHVPAGQQATLVLGLRVGGDDGRADAVRVTYTVGSSRPKTVRTVIAHRVVAQGEARCF